MTIPIYNQPYLNARLAAVAATIDGGGGNGNLLLLAGAHSSQVISTMPLARPSATVISDGILSLNGTPIDVSAAGTGVVTGGAIQDSVGNVVVSGLTAGTLGSTADIIMTSLSIVAGQVIGLTGFTITGA